MVILTIGQSERIRQYSPKSIALENYQIKNVSGAAAEQEILEAGKDADVIIVDAISTVSGKMIEAMPNLKMIHSEGVAFNRIDLEAARKKQVYVCNCKGMNATAVGEQAILLMLGLLRGVVNGDQGLREGRQIQIKENYMRHGSLKELGECTLGLIGFGDIARATARMASVFGTKVIYSNRHQANAAVEAEYGVTYRPMKELLAESDIVSIHLPVAPDTAGIADADFFAAMKEGSYFINTARGELVDQEALLDALRSGHLAGAGLDTITGEPVLKDNFMLTAEKEVEDKILYSCHIGGITGASFRRGYEMIWSNIHKIEQGETPERIVNPW